MIPEPEREQAVREHLSGMFADAPEPDPIRLAAGLEAVRSRRKRRLRARRAVTWLAVACLFVAGTATALWFAGSGRGGPVPAGSVQSDGRNERPTEEPSGGTAPERSVPDDGESGGGDSPVIYQRVN